MQVLLCCQNLPCAEGKLGLLLFVCSVTLVRGAQELLIPLRGGALLLFSVVSSVCATIPWNRRGGIVIHLQPVSGLQAVLLCKIVP